MKTKILTLTIAAVLPVTWAFAQDDGPPRPPGPPRDGEHKGGPRDGERPKGDGPRDGEGRKGDGPREGHRPPGPMPFLRELDADDDGIISADEIKGAPEALKKLDKNNDGKLTPEEWHPHGPGAGPRPGGDREGQPKSGTRDGEKKRGDRRDGDSQTNGKKREKSDGQQNGGEGRPPAPPLLEALDADHDGTISAEEIDKSSESLAKLDQNSDGQLGPREYGPRPPKGPPQDGGEKPVE